MKDKRKDSRPADRQDRRAWDKRRTTERRAQRQRKSFERGAEAHHGRR